MYYKIIMPLFIIYRHLTTTYHESNGPKNAYEFHFRITFSPNINANFVILLEDQFQRRI
jgi:hypothetical protein